MDPIFDSSSNTIHFFPNFVGDISFNDLSMTPAIFTSVAGP